MQGKKDYQEKLFTSFQLSDRVPVDNFYRRLKAALDLHWLYKATASYYGSEGQKSIDPVVFFKLILVGYLENLNSDRKIIAHAEMRLDILFFLGYGLDEELPWHSTISGTRGLYSEEVFKELFSKVLSLCVSKGMLSGRRQAIDSAFVKANASMDSLVEKEIIEDGEHYLDELQHDDYGKEVEQHDNVMKDDRDSDTITKSRSKSTEEHHSWKGKTYQDKKGYYKKQYRSSAKDCGHCPLRTSCIGGRADYKKLEETIDKPLYDQMHQRLQTPYAKKMKKRRQSTVEPVLGTLINFMGLRRVWTRGLKNANKFMLGAAAAYNLKKWLNHEVKKSKEAAVMVMKKAKERLCFFVFWLVRLIAAVNGKTAAKNPVY